MLTFSGVPTAETNITLAMSRQTKTCFMLWRSVWVYLDTNATEYVTLGRTVEQLVTKLKVVPL